MFRGSRLIVRRLLHAAVLCALMSSPTTATADTARARARAAYDAAVEAASQQQYLRAAQLFSEADAIVPNPVALRSAIEAAVLADEPVLTMRLVERALKHPASEELARAAEQARSKLAHRTGRLLVSCEGSCEVRLDGAAVAPSQSIIVAVGEHRVVIVLDDEVQRRTVKVAAGETAEIVAKPTPAPVAIAPTEDEGGGISQAWFWIGAATTAALTAASIASAVDTDNLHDAYLQTGEGADDGSAAQLRTNVLFFSTLGVGVATAAIGLFAVRWSGNTASAEAALSPGGVMVSGRF